MKKAVTFVIIALLAVLFVVPAFAAPATDTLDITVHKAVNRPIIDGKVETGEWGDAVMYQESGAGYTFYPDQLTGTSENGIKATIYMLWDETGFYVAAVAEDPIHFNQYSALDIWNGDAFEFDSNFNKDDYTDRNRQCMGLNNDGEICGGSYKVATGVDWEENSEIEFTEYKIARDGNKTTYEFFVKWENFCPEGAAFAKVGNIFRGNVQFHLATDGDYIECQRYVAYDAEKEESTYPNFILSEVASAPVIEDVSETTPASEVEGKPVAPVQSAPQTSDNFIMILALAIVMTAITFKAFKSIKTIHNSKT